MFIELKPNEKIVLVIHRYWLVILFHILKILPLFALPLFSRLMAERLIDTTDPLFSEIFWLASAFWWLFLWGWLGLVWVNYYLDLWIVTNQRIIDVRQKNLFRREVAELTLLKIQDLTTKINGILRTALNFGNLEIRSAGTFEAGQESNIFILEDIAEPSEVQSLLSGLHQDYLKKNEGHV